MCLSSLVSVFITSVLCFFPFMVPGVMHLMGTLKSLARGLSHLDLSRTGITSRCVNKVADTISQSQTLLASLQTLKVAENGQKGEDVAVGA